MQMETKSDNSALKFGELVQVVFGMGGGAIRNMNVLFLIIGLIMLGFAFFVSPYLPFFVFVIINMVVCT